MSKLEIIYIIGAARSGSTLLEIVLGNQDGLVSVGELNRYPKHCGVPHISRNKDVSVFWEKIRKGVPQDLRMIKNISDKLEFHTGIFKSHFVSKNDIAIYEEYNLALFSAIQSSIPKNSVIIDSSKYPLRAIQLARIFGNRIGFIYLKRNPQDSVNSFQKKDVEQEYKSIFSANIYLLFINLLCVWNLRKIKRTHKVTSISYDSLVSDPILVMNQISKELDVDLSQVIHKLKDDSPFVVGKIFDGNRLRLKDEVRLKRKKKELNEKKTLFNVFFAPFHRIFWYQ